MKKFDERKRMRRKQPAEEGCETITRGSGDVFIDLDLDLSPEERIKIAIALEITRVIAINGLTQVEAARRLGTDQAKVSRISRGQVGGFSIDRLMDFLTRLGIDVAIRTSVSNNRMGRVSINEPYEAVG